MTELKFKTPHYVQGVRSRVQKVEMMRLPNFINITVKYKLSVTLIDLLSLKTIEICTINLKKTQVTNWKKKFRCTEKKFSSAGPEIFLRFETDLNFSRPSFSEIKVQIKWPSIGLGLICKSALVSHLKLQWLKESK